MTLGFLSRNLLADNNGLSNSQEHNVTPIDPRDADFDTEGMEDEDNQASL
jgi:hypothetical protein